MSKSEGDADQGFPVRRGPCVGEVPALPIRPSGWPGRACHQSAHRKMDAEDPFDTISGTHGLTGVPDTLMVLARSGERVTLAAKGRDLDDYEKALERDRGTGSWRIVGDARELAKTCEREAVLEVLREAGEPMRATEIATETGGKRENIKRLLARMAKAGEVTRVKTGVYTCPNGPNGPNRHESGGYGGSDDDE